MQWSNDGKLTMKRVAAKDPSVNFMTPKISGEKIEFTLDGLALASADSASLRRYR